MAVRLSSATWVRGITDRSIARVVGDESLSRGQAYAQSGAVLTLVEGAQGDLLLATVRGSGSRNYQTVIERFDDSLSSEPDWSGKCSCPVGVDCKHTAAVVLTAREALTPSARPALASWEQQLAPLTVAADPTSDLPGLGLEMSLVSGPAYPGQPAGMRVAIRPLRPGKSKPWVKQGVNWSDFGPGWRQAKVRPDHRTLMTEILALHRSGSPAYYGYGNPQVHLADLSAAVWPLLRRCIGAGIPLVAQGSDLLSVQLLEEPASVVLDVTRQSDDGPLSVRPVLSGLTPDVSTPDTEITMLGRPPHGVAALRPDGRLTLAPLVAPPPEALIALLTSGADITVPAGDTPRFLALYYPVLARQLPAQSSDGSVALPADTAPVLTLDAIYDSGHRVRLSWGFGYRLPREHDEEALVRVGLHASEHDPPRDVEYEQRLLDGLTELSVIPRMTHRSASGVVQPYPQGGLFGMDTVTFSTQVMPALQARDDVVVQVEGEPPEYQEADEAPMVHLATVDDEERADGDWFDLHVSVSVDGQQVPFGPLFTALARDEEVMLLDSGTWFTLNRPELHSLRTLIEEARELTDAQGDTLRVSRYQVDLWDELEALGVVEQQSSRWGESIAALRGLSQATPPPVPTELRATLRPYQLDGYQWLSALWDAGLGGVLADDMGLGKTLQTLAMASRAKERGELDSPLLVVAPASVVGTWLDEAARFTPELRVVAITATGQRRGMPLPEAVAGAHLVVTSYTLLRLEDEAYRSLPWSGLVLDEAQFVKNHRSRTYQAARRLGAPFTLAITGTPLENSLMDLWSMLSLSSPGLFPRPEVFAERYRKPIESGTFPEQLAVLRRRLRPFMLRRTKAEVAPELPDKQEQVVHVELSPAHRRIYAQHLQRERQRVLGLLADLDHNRIAIFRALTLLRQLSLDPVLVDPTYAGTAPSAKIDALLQQLGEVTAEGHRALVFSSFTGFLKLVRDRLDDAGIGYAYLDGRTKDRPKKIAAWRTGSDPVFLISLKAGGFGLTLTEADYVFILDPWWNPAAETQAVDRTHRIGQTRPVMVYRMVSQDTIEDKVVALQARKRDLFAKVVDGGEFSGAAISADDIQDLLQG